MLSRICSTVSQDYLAFKHAVRNQYFCPTEFAPIHAVAYNVPRFFEFYYDGEEGRIVMTALRANDAYITYYVFWGAIQ